MTSNRSSFQSSTSGQWRAPVSTHLCAFCNKTVYPAEEVMGAGQRFHKLCLKCSNILSSCYDRFGFFLS